MTAKTHKGRAEAVARVLAPDAGIAEHYAAEIAHGTFPTELVRAARAMRKTFCDSHEFCMDDPDGLLPRSHHPDCITLRDALALYEETP